MEFKKIDDTKFQCIVYEEDLDENNICLDDFFKNNITKIHDFLAVIMEEARKDIGIEMGGWFTTLQVAPQPDHSIVLTISTGKDDFGEMLKHADKRLEQLFSKSSHSSDNNIIKRDEADERVKKASFSNVNDIDDNKYKKNNAANAVNIYAFESLFQLEQMCEVIPRTWGVKNCVYKDKTQSRYFLVLEKQRCSAEKFQMLCDMVYEYGTFVADKKEIIGYYDEHYQLLIKANAINSIKKYCEV